jgi:hypothetical protein
MRIGVAEPNEVNKPRRSSARPLAELLNSCISTAFARQGFAAREIVTHWPEIVGDEIAAVAEPIRMQWPRNPEGATPATLVLRVEGPAAIEVQHQSGLVIERVNRFFGWQAIDRLAFRQAPLRGQRRRPQRARIDPDMAARIAHSLTIEHPALRDALGRLGAALRRK